MAKNDGIIQIVGTVGDKIFYKIKGRKGIFVKTKGGPSKKMWKKDKKFAGTRKAAAVFGRIRFAPLSKHVEQPWRAGGDPHLRRR